MNENKETYMEEKEQLTITGVKVSKTTQRNGQQLFDTNEQKSGRARA